MTWSFDPDKPDTMVAPELSGVTVKNVTRFRIALQRLDQSQRNFLEEVFNNQHPWKSPGDAGGLFAWLGVLDTFLLEQSVAEGSGQASQYEGRELGLDLSGSAINRPPKRHQNSRLVLRSAIRNLDPRRGIEMYNYFCFQEQLPKGRDPSVPASEADFTLTLWVVGFEWYTPPPPGALMEPEGHDDFEDTRNQIEKDAERAAQLEMARKAAEERARNEAEAS